MTAPPDQELRDRLRSELAAVAVSSPPVTEVARQARSIRGRRQAITGALLAAAVVIGAAGYFQAVRATPARMHTVTMNQPDPRAPGGVFASGTADGRPWRLAVRNVGGAGRSCLPAVLLNGRDGDMLFTPRPRSPAIRDPAFLISAPGWPGIGFAFFQVTPDATTVAIDARHRVITRPVSITMCGHQFHLAGFAFSDPRRGVSAVYAGTRLIIDEVYYPPKVIFTGKALDNGTYAPGAWQNEDPSPWDIMASLSVTTTIASGTTGSTSWAIRVGIGLYGECFTGTTITSDGPGMTQSCQPLAAQPSGMLLSWVPFPANTSEIFAGYAGPVSPRTAFALVTLANHKVLTALPTTVDGRKYLAFAVTGLTRVTRVTIYDGSRFMIATTTSMPSPR